MDWERKDRLARLVVAALGYNLMSEELRRDQAELLEFVTLTLAEARITMSDFVELDERPGRWGHDGPNGEWHWALRRWRNNASTAQRARVFGG